MVLVLSICTCAARLGDERKPAIQSSSFVRPDHHFSCDSKLVDLSLHRAENDCYYSKNSTKRQVNRFTLLTYLEHDLSPWILANRLAYCAMWRCGVCFLNRTLLHGRSPHYQKVAFALKVFGDKSIQFASIPDKVGSEPVRTTQEDLKMVSKAIERWRRDAEVGLDSQYYVWVLDGDAIISNMQIDFMKQISTHQKIQARSPHCSNHSEALFTAETPSQLIPSSSGVLLNSGSFVVKNTPWVRKLLSSVLDCWPPPQNPKWNGKWEQNCFQQNMDLFNSTWRENACILPPNAINSLATLYHRGDFVYHEGGGASFKSKYRMIVNHHLGKCSVNIQAFARLLSVSHLTQRLSDIEQALFADAHNYALVSKHGNSKTVEDASRPQHKNKISNTIGLKNDL